MSGWRALAGLLGALSGVTGQPPSSGAEAEAAELLARVQDRYAEQRTARLTFTERYVSKATGSELVESGTLLVDRPGRMRWEYRDPEEKLFVVNGERAWFYVPEDGVAWRLHTRAAESRRLPALFLAGKGDLVRDFQPALESGGNTPVLRLVPRHGGEDYEHLLLKLGREDGAILGLTVVDGLGNVTSFEFRDEATGVAIEGNPFEFTPPRGVEVVEPRQDR